MPSWWQRLSGSAVVAAHVWGQRRAPYLPRPRLEARRDRRIRRLVAHAARTVPYYRDWFARERLDPREIRGAADLDRLPVLDRQLVRRRPDLFVARTAAVGTGLSFTTSGTTGEPLEVHHDRRSLLANIAYGERERAPIIAMCGAGFNPKEVYVGYETSTFKNVQAFYDRNTLMPIRPRRRFVSLHEPVERVAEVVNTEQPDVLVGYGGWLALFFRSVEARRLLLHRPKLVLYMGEALPHGAREQIEGGFGIPLMSRYNAVEAFKLGFFCERRTGFHLHEDLCHVRIAGADGATQATGRQGAIVISNLVNRATVLLNYPIGDVGALCDEPCPCGRTFRLLGELEGRVEDVLRLPGERVVHPRAVWEALKSEREILQYQLTQCAPAGFRLALVSLDDAAFARARERLVPRLHRLLGEDVDLEVVHSARIERGESGKFRAVVSLRPPPAESDSPA